MPDLDQELRRMEKLIDDRVHREVYNAELTNVKDDIQKIERKLDRMLESQSNTQRTAIWQLIMIIVTLVVAVIGAVGGMA